MLTFGVGCRLPNIEGLRLFRGWSVGCRVPAASCVLPRGSPVSRRPYGSSCFFLLSCCDPVKFFNIWTSRSLVEILMCTETLPLSDYNRPTIFYFVCISQLYFALPADQKSGYRQTVGTEKPQAHCSFRNHQRSDNVCAYPH